MSSEALPFDYADPARGLVDPIRSDLVRAHRSAWQRLARPGTWWSGAERVAIATAARAGASCGFCRTRRAALSPTAVEGAHDGEVDGPLSPAAVDAVHRIVTDASRLSEGFVTGLAGQGIPDGHYVELVSVIVSVRCIDAFHRAMGMAPEPLPEPIEGLPSRRRPERAGPGPGWVDMLPGTRATGAEADLWPGPAPNVVRALSLVPDAVRWLKELSAAQYLSMEEGEMLDFTRGRGPLGRAQTELVAGRVSALNECFY